MLQQLFKGSFRNSIIGMQGKAHGVQDTGMHLSA